MGRSSRLRDRVAACGNSAPAAPRIPMLSIRFSGDGVHRALVTYARPRATNGSVQGNASGTLTCNDFGQRRGERMTRQGDMTNTRMILVGAAVLMTLGMGIRQSLGL